MKKKSNMTKAIILKHGYGENDEGGEMMAVHYKTKKAARRALLGVLRAKAEKDYSALVAERNLLATGKAKLCVAVKDGNVTFDAMLGDDFEVNRLIVSSMAAVFKDVIGLTRESEVDVQ